MNPYAWPPQQIADLWLFRLSRYVHFDANQEAKTAGPGANPVDSSASAVQGTVFGDQATVASPVLATMGSPTGMSSRDQQGWTSDGMADLHLSGSDPRIFPGVFTRGHRSGSSRTLNQAHDGKPPSPDLLGLETP